MILIIIPFFSGLMLPIFGSLPVLQENNSFGCPLNKHLFGHPDSQQKKVRDLLRCVLGQTVTVRLAIFKLGGW